VTRQYESSISFEYDPSGQAASGELFVSFLDPVLVGAGFGRLDFEVLVAGKQALSATFTDAAAALLYFDDQVHSLGVWGPDSSTLPIVLRLLVESDRVNGGFSADMLVTAVLPEPRHAVLLLLALAVGLHSNRRRTPIRARKA